MRAVIAGLAAFLLSGCATGSATVAGAPRASTSPDSVHVYFSPPSSFDVLGSVEAMVDSHHDEKASVDAAVKELKKQAAKVGANGVLLRDRGQRVTSEIETFIRGRKSVIPTDVHKITGQAIEVNL